MNTPASPLTLPARRILVTGGARGLGLAFARALCTDGAQVALADRRADLLAESVQALREAGHTAHALVYDATDPASIRHCAGQAATLLGGLDGLVNNAAVTDSGGRSMDDIDIDTWDQVMQVNVRGTWLMTSACRAALRESGRGAVVNLASDTALWGAPRLMAYVASKGAVMAMTRAMARELGADSITVNAIAPGLVLCEATEYVPQDRHQLYITQRALQREQLPGDVAGAVLYLLGDGARFVTGQVLPVNGGFVMH